MALIGRKSMALVHFNAMTPVPAVRWRQFLIQGGEAPPRSQLTGPRITGTPVEMPSSGRAGVTIGIADDLVLVLSDIDVAADDALLPADSGGTVGMLFGREGNRVLVNGRRLPELIARSGAPQRWRVVNAAKSRYSKLDLGEGHVFRKIGGDGGLTEYSEDHDFIVLGAGERADVLVTPTGLEPKIQSAVHVYSGTEENEQP